jgi:hypothetical protein
MVIANAGTPSLVRIQIGLFSADQGSPSTSAASPAPRSLNCGTTGR